MSSTLPGADVRGFYSALGIELPGWARHEASVACFANPDAHAHGDRDPSCSVNVETGAWHCWGCEGAGGAYDAALARGRSPRDAIDLMIAHGLTTRRAGPGAARTSSVDPRRPAPPTDRERARPARAQLAADEQQLATAHERLAALRWPARLLRDQQRRVWSRATLLQLGCGWERGRVIIPIRNRRGELRGVLRYAPSHDRAPKMLAVRGTQLGLIPHPCTEPSTWVMLVEGPPDMITARSRGLPAIAVPGDDAWEPEWARLFAGRQVSVVLDCDRAGREAAARIAADLKAVGVRGSIVELARGRADGYDLTDWLAERESLGAQHLRPALDRAPGCRRRVGDRRRLYGDLVRVAIRRPLLGCVAVVHGGRAAGQDRADGTVRDGRGRGDLAVRESEPAGAADGPLVLGVGVVLALGRAGYLPEHVCAEFLAGALLAVAFGVGDRVQPRAGGDRGARGLGNATSRLVDPGWVLAGLRLQPVVGRRGDRFQLGRQRAVGGVVSSHAASCRSCSPTHDPIRPGRHQLLRGFAAAASAAAASAPPHCSPIDM